MNAHSFGQNILSLPPKEGSLPMARPANPPAAPLFALALATLLAACGDKPEAAQGGGPPQMPPAQVTVVTLRSEPVTLTRELPGRTVPVQVAEVRPQVSGIVRTRLFTEGALVRAGQPLYQLDDAVYRADYETARAAVAKAEAAVEAARLTARRSAELREIDAVSEQETENAVAAQRAAEADLAAARARVERERVNLTYSRIVAPIAGRIGMSTITAGALVTANQTEPLATVQKLDPMFVDVTQSSSEWLRMQRDIASGRVTPGDAGTPVRILLEDGTPYPHEGRLQSADVTVDEATGSFTLRVLVPNPENMLRPGMYVKAVLAEAEAAEAVLAPQQGITRDPKGTASALVVLPDNTVEQRTVKVARTIGDRWLVEEGLAAGDRVIVEGLQKARPGAPVVAVEQGAAAPPAAPAGAAPGAPAAAGSN
jgi:membrane fusion protein (multidrug efflux system)